jgi:hypothetical protein
MNGNQRKLLIGICVVVLCMLLFPPYREYSGALNKSNVIIDSGYSFIFDISGGAILDISTLFTQWLGVLIVGVIGFFILNSKHKE